MVADVVESGEEKILNFIVLFLCGGGNKNCIILLFIPVLSKSVEILPDILLQPK